MATIYRKKDCAYVFSSIIFLLILLHLMPFSYAAIRTSTVNGITLKVDTTIDPTIDCSLGSVNENGICLLVDITTTSIDCLASAINVNGICLNMTVDKTDISPPDIPVVNGIALDVDVSYCHKLNSNDASSPSAVVCNSYCGDGQLDSDEECDGSKNHGQTCISEGYLSGTIGCTACNLDTSGCYNDECGNGVIDVGEDCDGLNLNSKSCLTEGYDGGTLSCDGSCNFITSLCYTCGDGNVDVGEDCDGLNLNGHSCVTDGFDGGALACDGSCSFDTSSCYGCGDGNVDAGEECDDGTQCYTTSGLTAHYNFDGNADDVAGSFGTASLKGSASIVSTARGQVLFLDGVSGFVNTTYPILSGNQLTYGAWIYVNTNPINYYSILDQDAYSTYEGFEIFWTPGSLLCWNGVTQAGVFSPLEDIWYNAYCVHNGTHFALFVNGQLKGPWVASTVSSNPSIALTFGFDDTDSYYMDGFIDDVMIYNRALTQPELLEIYNSQLTGTCSINSDTTPDACRTDCTAAGCGDGIIDTGETCDDGNTANNDGCSSSCQDECVLNSVSILLTDSITNGVADPGEKILITGDLNPNSDCSAASHIQVDAADAGTICDIQWNLGDLKGIYNSSLSLADDAPGFITSWKIPSSIPLDCLGKTIFAGGSFLWDTNPDGNPVGNFVTAAGSFTFLGSICSDGAVTGLEQCDGSDLDSQTCVTQGFDGGTLSCNGSCNFVTSSCYSCGDGTANTGEQCDGSDLKSQTCTSLGFGGGTLGCDVSCNFVTSSCYSCGDGTANTGEQCDGSDLKSQTCTSQGFDGGTLSCDGSCNFVTSSCYSCGDGTADPSEQCDGSDLKSETCTSQGFDGGTLSCDGSCNLITSSCYICGDGTVNTNEQCDSSDMDGETCISQGFGGGTLGCDVSCNFVTSSCYTCGDGTADAGEQCDGIDFKGETCITQGFTAGNLNCDGSCNIDTSACTSCGDSIAGPGEQCDNSDLKGETCITQGYEGGTLSCDGSCNFITSSCYACGNSIAEASEECDGSDLNGVSCITHGYSGGTLACDAGCLFDISGCYTCGDNNADIGEECDGSDHNGADCTTLGYYSGILTCSLECTHDISGCYSVTDTDLSAYVGRIVEIGGECYSVSTTANGEGAAPVVVEASYDNCVDCTGS